MNKIYICDYNELYKNDNNHNKDKTRFEYGLYQIGLIAMQRKRLMLTKTEYNTYRRAIEEQLMDIK